MKQRKYLFAVLSLLLLVFAACKGESPTSPTPPVTGTTGTTGTTTPPTAASVTLTVSNANVQVNALVTITATVTQNGNPVPNGTAVQFSSSGGAFTDVGASGTSVIKTTTNGVATATLTSSAAGTITVTATVNNVSKQATVVFSATPVTPTPTPTTPTVTAITPNTGPPAGGETVTINGTNFRAPVRVVFTCEGATGGTAPDPAGCSGQGPKDALVTGVSPTAITVIAPPFNVPTGKALSFSVTVFVGAGTSTETSIAQSGAIIYTSPTLTPAVRAVSPSSGPVEGGTRITIIGDSFQAPVQVFFNAAEAEVINVTFNQIIVMSPKASDTAPGGSGTITGPVDIIVRNIGSGTSTTFSGGFRYTPKIVITTAGPTVGPITGGTQVTIDGSGFVAPVGVVIGGVAAQVIRVSGTEVVAITGPPLLTTCANVSGAITVTNTDNGDTATGPLFTFIVPLPHIVSVSGPSTLGGSTTVTVLNASGVPRITIGGIPATITGTTVNADGTTTFTVVVPPSLTLNTASCLAVSGASNQQPTPFDVIYLSLTTGCTDTFPKGLIVNPTGAILTLVPAAGFSPFAATAATGTSPAIPAPDQTVTFTNTGGGTLTINSVATTCNAPPFTEVNGPTPVTLNPCDPFTITVHYATQASGASANCQVTVNTSVGSRTLVVTGSTR